MTKQTYLMKEITPKNGVLRQVHLDALNKKCKFVELELGNRAIFYYDHEGERRFISTSPVVEIKWNDVFLTINTMNTVYELELIE